MERQPQLLESTPQWVTEMMKSLEALPVTIGSEPGNVVTIRDKGDRPRMKHLILPPRADKPGWTLLLWNSSVNRFDEHPISTVTDIFPLYRKYIRAKLLDRGGIVKDEDE